MVSTVFTDQELKKAGIIFLSSKELTTSFETRFSGIVYLNDTIIIGEEAFLNYTKQEPFQSEKFFDGRFGLIAEEKDCYIAKTDALGQEIFYYYKKNKDWAFSNSFYYLLQWLETNKISCKAYEASLYSGLIGNPFFSTRQGHTLGRELLSNNTTIEEIKVLPKNFYLKIRRETNTLEVLEDKNIYIDPNKTYEELLLDYVTKWSSRIKALAEKFPHTIKIDLTGGLDSRVILALTSFSLPQISQLHFQSSQKEIHQKDFQIANMIGNFLGFSIQNKLIFKERISPLESYELWKYGNLGVYFPIYFPTHREPTNIFYLQGSGGESFRQYYTGTAKQIAQRVHHYFPNEYSLKLVQKELLDSVTNLGYSTSSLEGMREHYKNFRSRFHFGRNWIRTCSFNCITPFNSLELNYAAKKLSDLDIASNKIHCDLLCLLNPLLATMPFDETSKTFSVEQLDKAPFKGLLKSTFPEKSLLVRQTESKVEESKSKIDYTQKNFIQILRADLSKNFEPLKELGGFSEKIKNEMENSLLEKENFSITAQKTSYLLSVGMTLKLTGFEGLRKKPLTAERVGKNF
jgi:hypothetical protein